MFYPYLFAAVLGGTLVLAGAVTGGHHGEVAHGPDGPGHDQENSASGVLVSLRFWTYFLAFAGTTGLLLRAFAGAGEPLTALIAVGTGLASGLGARLAFGRATSQASEGLLEDGELAGRTAQLLLPCAPGLTGQVRLYAQGRTIDLLARTDEPGGLREREEVLVVEVKDGVALVVRSPSGGGPAVEG